MIVTISTNIPLQSGINGQIAVDIKIRKLLSSTAKLYPGVYFTAENNLLAIMIDNDDVERDLEKIKSNLLTRFAEIEQLNVEILQIQFAAFLPNGPVQLSGLLLMHYHALTRIGVPSDLQSAIDAYTIRIQSIQARFRLYREGNNNSFSDLDNFNSRGTFMGNRVNFMSDIHSHRSAFARNPFQYFDTQENLRKLKQLENIEIEKTLMDVIGLIEAYNAQRITGEQARRWMNIYAPNLSNCINTVMKQEGEETYIEILIVTKNPTNSYDSYAHAKRIAEIDIFSNLCRRFLNFDSTKLSMPVGNPIWTLQVKNYVVPDAQLESFKCELSGLLYQAGLDKGNYIGGINLTLEINNVIRQAQKAPAPIDIASNRPIVTHTDAPHIAAGRAHERLLKHLKQSTPEDKLDENKPFFDAINERQYTKALRRACTSKDEQTALKLIKVLMSYKGRLNINVNEQAGPEQLTALHHAAKSTNTEIYHFIVRQDADQTIADKAGMKASAYVQNVHLQKQTQA
jgi:hypothetical protein